MKNIVINGLNTIINELCRDIDMYSKDFQKPELAVYASNLETSRVLLNSAVKLSGAIDDYTINSTLKKASEAIWGLAKNGFKDTAEYFRSILLEWKYSMKEEVVL